MICCTSAVIVNFTTQNTKQQHNGRNDTLSVQGVFITEGGRAFCMCWASDMIPAGDEWCHVW
jgi:hypothetical protein